MLPGVAITLVSLGLVGLIVSRKLSVAFVSWRARCVRLCVVFFLGAIVLAHGKAMSLATAPVLDSPSLPLSPFLFHLTFGVLSLVLAIGGAAFSLSPILYSDRTYRRFRFAACRARVLAFVESALNRSQVGFEKRTEFGSVVLTTPHGDVFVRSGLACCAIEAPQSLMAACPSLGSPEAFGLGMEARRAVTFQRAIYGLTALAGGAMILAYVLSSEYEPSAEPIGVTRNIEPWSVPEIPSKPRVSCAPSASARVTPSSMAGNVTTRSLDVYIRFEWLGIEADWVGCVALLKEARGPDGAVLRPLELPASLRPCISAIEHIAANGKSVSSALFQFSSSPDLRSISRVDGWLTMIKAVGRGSVRIQDFVQEKDKTFSSDGFTFVLHSYAKEGTSARFDLSLTPPQVKEGEPVGWPQEFIKVRIEGEKGTIDSEEERRLGTRCQATFLLPGGQEAKALLIEFVSRITCESLQFHVDDIPVTHSP